MVERVSLSGRIFRPKVQRYTMPTTARMLPTRVRSNISKGRSPMRSAVELTKILVEVPIRVQQSPKMDAKERGINNLDGRMF